MIMLRTYSRKSKVGQSSQGTADLHKSSQDSFFDSPGDPYFFDSQTSTTEDISAHSSPHATKAVHEVTTLKPGVRQSELPAEAVAQAVKNGEQGMLAPCTASVSSETSSACLPRQVAAAKQQPAQCRSRLSQSSSQPQNQPQTSVAAATTDRAWPRHSAKLKHATVAQVNHKRRSALSWEGSVPKKACTVRTSTGSVSRSRNSSGKATSSTSRPDPAPAVTVLEAQESGEHTQIVDEIVYALDGLGKHCSKNSWQDSASTLAQICTTRRGKQAFRVEGLFKETMSAALGLPLQHDHVTALAFAAILLAFATGDVANRALLAHQEAVQLAGVLLKVHTVSNSNSTPAEKKLCKVLGQGPLHAALAAQDASTPSLIVTRALSIALGPEKSSSASEALKNGLRTENVLLDLAHAVQHHAELDPQASSCEDEAPVRERQMAAVNQSLTVLEHASFACPSNEQHLVDLHMQLPAGQPRQEPAASASSCQATSGTAFPSWLVQQMVLMQTELAGHSLSQRQHGVLAWSCMQSGLSVLINMTHHNGFGCDAVVAAGGMQMAANVLTSSLTLTDASMDPGAAAVTTSQILLRDRQHVLAHVGTLTAALGLLINLVEASVAYRKQLKALQLGCDDSTLHVLCRLMQASAACDVDKDDRQHSGTEVTEQHITDGEEDGTASIVEVYSALLLGFLLADDASMQAEAVVRLGSLKPVTAAIRRCLAFYVDLRAITSQSEESLRTLLLALPSSDCDSRL